MFIGKKGLVSFLIGLFLAISHLPARAETLPPLQVSVEEGERFNANEDLRLSLEFTTIFHDKKGEEEYSALTYDIAQKLSQHFPETNQFRQKSPRKWSFNDGLAKGDWDIEIDGNLYGRPIVEVTTPYVHNERSQIFDLTMDVFSTLPAAPVKETGGGHIRVKIHKKDITPAQLASFLRFYYSYEDILIFSFRHEKRSHKTAARTFDEAGFFEGFKPYLKRMGGSDQWSYEDYREQEMKEPNMEQIGGYMKSKEILSSDVKSYNKYFALNMGRLYQTYYETHKNHLIFEFRFFDAPRTKREARLHLRLVMALFQKALNTQAKFDPVHYGKARFWRTNTDAYQRDLKEFLELLRLPFDDYEYLLHESRHRR